MKTLLVILALTMVSSTVNAHEVSEHEKYYDSNKYYEYTPEYKPYENKHNKHHEDTKIVYVDRTPVVPSPTSTTYSSRYPEGYGGTINDNTPIVIQHNKY